MVDQVGTFRRYSDTNFRPERLERVLRAAKIVEDYERRGISMSLRQLYYQLVARGLVPNQVEEYNRLGDDVSDGRMAGLISWTGIEDRRRGLKGFVYSEDPASALRGLADGFKIDKWERQPWRPEVWVEKEALEGVVGVVCGELDVDYFACVGYNSQSEQWRAGRRFAGYVATGQRPVVFHLGDHDPSGLDMTRDNRDRIAVFAGVPVQVTRLALNRDQIERYRPPPNPAKSTDSRFAAYLAQYGSESWELDALDPAVIQQVVRDAVLSVRDQKLWDAALVDESAAREVLVEFSEQLGESDG